MAGVLLLCGDLHSEFVGVGSMESLRLRELGNLADFELQERHGGLVTNNDLKGKVWIADFIFTRCAGPCVELTKAMKGLNAKLSEEIRFVTVTIDPEYDTPEVLRKYADLFGADRQRWLFLTGDKERVNALIRKGFKVAGGGGDFHHTQKMVLVDERGIIRGYYDGLEEDGLRMLRQDAHSLITIMPLRIFPPLNACLNGAAFCLLLAGYIFIRQKKVMPHKVCMLTAFGTSGVFLCSYLYYHAYSGSTPFQGAGVVRTIYFTILITHSVLAAAVPVLAIIAIYRAFKGQIDKHARIARWALPIWMYVSVTGVTIYWMLYRMSF